MLRKLKLKQKNDVLIKKTCNYMEQDSTKNHVLLVKTSRVSKCTISMQNYVIHKINIWARVKNVILSLF